MTRNEVFAPPPDLGSERQVKMGCTQNGRIVAAEAVLNYQAELLQLSVSPASMSAFTRYDLDNVHVVGNDVTVNRRKWRRTGRPRADRGVGVESVIDEMARSSGSIPSNCG